MKRQVGAGCALSKYWKKEEASFLTHTKALVANGDLGHSSSHQKIHILLRRQDDYITTTTKPYKTIYN